jgi:protein-S-isoprenylcysteine O-methyltransferase Ste14
LKAFASVRARKWHGEDIIAHHQTTTPKEKKVPFGMYIFFVIYTLLFPALPMLIAGTFRWPAAWWYYGAAVVATVLSRLLVLRVNPDQLRERGTSLNAENTEDWDRLLSPLVGLVIPLITLIVAGFDHRWSWSPAFPSWVLVVSLLILVAAYAFTTWAFIVNRFFSGVVRIQEDRGHEVMTAGPYRIVRHPGYLGALFSMLAAALLLGSLWALVPVLFYAAVVVARTELEDRMLQEKLPGYRSYADRTRYKLLPGIW